MCTFVIFIISYKVRTGANVDVVYCHQIANNYVNAGNVLSTVVCLCQGDVVSLPRLLCPLSPDSPPHP